MAAAVTRRIGILGGMFDPIHAGHIDAADAARSALGLGEIWIVPSHIAPHRPPAAASAYHRFAMAALAISGRPDWRVSDVELLREEPSYTIDTLVSFHRAGYAAQELFFILGADAFSEIETWHAYPAVLDAAHFAVVSRPGTPAPSFAARIPTLASRIAPASAESARTSIFLVDRATADVSSTAIRQLVASERSIVGLVPVAVAQHIERHGLYGRTGRIQSGDPNPDGPSANRLHGQE